MEEVFYRKMADLHQKSTGIKVVDTSDVGMKYRVVASFLAPLYEKIEEASIQVLPSTATGNYLDSHGRLRGIIRRSGTPSTGSVTFVGKREREKAITIKKGTLCQTIELNPRSFITDEDGTLKINEDTLKIPCTSQNTGANENISAFIIGYLPVDIEGIKEIYNEEVFLGAEDKEGDESFRGRIMLNYQNQSNGMNIGYYKNLLLDFPKIIDSKIHIYKNEIKLVLLSKIPFTKEELMEVKTLVEEKKELGKEVVVKNAELKPETLHVGIYLKDYSKRSFLEVADDFKESVKSYLGRVGIEEDLILSKIIALGLKDEDILDLVIFEPYSNIKAGIDQKIEIKTLTIIKGE